MLSKITVKNLLGITEAEIELSSLTGLYGANGAGKSSIADAVLFALTGDVVRGSVVADVIRQGAKAAWVDVTLQSGPNIAREATAKGRTVYLDGVELASKDAAVAVAKVLPASPTAIRAALRAGAILDLKPADLQRLLVELTGAAVDGPAIGRALSSVENAMQRTGAKMPTALAGLDTLAADAVKGRKEAKQKKAAAESDLGGLPIPTVAGPAVDVAPLRARRDAAVRSPAGQQGARDERRRETTAHIAEIDAVLAKPAPAAVNVSAVVAKLDAAQVAVVRAEEAVRKLNADVVALRAKAAESVPAAGNLANAKALVDATAAQKAKAVAALDAKVAAGKALAEQVKTLRAGSGATCPHCTQTISPDVVADLEARLEKMRGERDALAEALRVEEAGLESARREVLQAERAAEIQGAKARLAEAEAALPGAKQAFDDAVKVEQAARAERDAATAIQKEHDARAEAVKRRDSLARELAALNTPSAPVEDVAALDAEIARAEEVKAAQPIIEKRARFSQWIKEAEAAIADHDAVEKGAIAAKIDLLAKAVGPFTDAANKALADIAPGFAVEVTSELEIAVRHGSGSLPVAMLSDGERTRVLYALQLAAVRLARVPLLVLDRGELVDELGRKAVKKLATTCAAEGIRVLLLSCAAPPAALPAGFAGYVVADGRATRIPTVEVKAA